MTLAQLNAYVTAVLRVQSQQQVNNMGSARVAYHADEKQYSQVIKDLMRDIR